MPALLLEFDLLFFVNDLLLEFGSIKLTVSEGHLTCDQIKKNDAQGPNIDTLVVEGYFLVKYFGCLIPSCANVLRPSVMKEVGGTPQI